MTFTSIHAQNFRACARRANGEVYCWGGQSGTGSPTATTIDRPTIIPGLIATSVRQTTFRNACAKVSGGQLYCWGTNSAVANGIVGDGTALDRTSPSSVINWPDGPAAGVAASVTVNSGSYSAIGGTAVAPLPAVTVRDRLGAPVAGATVTFSVQAGNGTVTGGTATTNASGVATVGSWTLPVPTGVAKLGVRCRRCRARLVRGDRASAMTFAIKARNARIPNLVLTGSVHWTACSPAEGA